MAVDLFWLIASALKPFKAVARQRRGAAIGVVLVSTSCMLRFVISGLFRKRIPCVEADLNEGLHTERLRTLPEFSRVHPVSSTGVAFA